MVDDAVVPLTTLTTNYGWVKPDIGASDDVWGSYLNGDLDGIDSTIKGVSNVANAAYPASNPSGYLPRSGVTNGSNAPAGQIGEYIALTVPVGSAVNIASGTANIASISLTAGDWDVWGTVFTHVGGGTTFTVLNAYINLVSTGGSGPTDSLVGSNGASVTVMGNALGIDVSASLSPVRLSSTTTQNVYLVAYGFGVSGGTMGAYGWISARRVR